MIPTTEKPSLLDLPLKRWFPANMETLLVVVVLFAAIVSRFYDLGARTMSHDEINHVVPTFSLYSGHGYQFDPMSHGPLQFHMMALSYALFGDNDFTTRIPAALFSVATIALAMLAFRRYLGRVGAIIAGVLFLISPLMLFYGRYARNEAYIVIWGLLTLYATLRYLESGKAWPIFLFTAVNALHFTDKVTAYMFAGELFLFLVAYFIHRMAHRPWPQNSSRSSFLLGLALSVALLAGAAVIFLFMKPLNGIAIKLAVGLLAIGGVASLAWAIFELVRSFGWANLRSERVLDLMILLVTFVLPLAGAIPIALLGKTPLDYSSAGVLRVVIVTTILGGLAVALGLWWFGRKWLLHAAIFFIPFVLLYSTFFTSPQGLEGGLVGALSYWSVQQDVARGGQPLYYYIFLLVPVYEFLPALGTVAAAVIASTKKLWQSQSGQPFKPAKPEASAEGSEIQPPVPVAALLVYWSVSSLALFTYSGEKMPWLTIHLALPMILSAAWAFGWMIETIPWGRIAAWGTRNFVRAVALAFFSLLALVTARTAFKAAYINYDYPLEFLVYAHAAPYPKALFNQISELSLRTAGGTDMVVAYDNCVRYPYWWYMRYFNNKIDYDINPTRDVRRALVIAGGRCPDDYFPRLQPIIQNNYNESDYMRLWWPTMDYWSLKWGMIESERNADLTANNPSAKVPPMTVLDYLKYVWQHIRPFFTDPAVRNAIWQIWFNRDYTAWAKLRGPNGSDAYTLTNWNTSERMYFLVRKDIASQLWPYGSAAQPVSQPVDPYTSITTPVVPDTSIGSAGSDSGQFQAPRAVALASDGSLYVVDSMNSRIQHLAPDGSILQVWGTHGDVTQGAAPGGTFNEPWGVAVAPDGSVFVADTWNYRIQKFTSDGHFLLMWGTGPGDGQGQFYGPRGLAVDTLGHVFVADTGNKRIVIYDSNGRYLGGFGTPGAQLGQLDEPVDIKLDSAGNAYVTDTWNQRIQVFAPDSTRLVYTASAEWPVDGWFGNGPENKPFISIDKTGAVFVSDPEQCRLISFSADGNPTHVWSGCAGSTAFQLPSGIALDGAGGVWVSDAANGKIVHFKIQNP